MAPSLALPSLGKSAIAPKRAPSISKVSPSWTGTILRSSPLYFHATLSFHSTSLQLENITPATQNRAWYSESEIILIKWREKASRQRPARLQVASCRLMARQLVNLHPQGPLRCKIFFYHQRLLFFTFNFSISPTAKKRLGYASGR